MSNQLESILLYLQIIQDDLAGVLVPAIIAAVVSLISLLVNSAISVIQAKETFNHTQFEYAQKVFPKINVTLQQMKFQLTLAQKCRNSFGESVSTALKNYKDYERDSTKYRRSHATEVQEIDNFISLMKKYIEASTSLYQLFISETLPAMPLLHPFLNKKIREMLSALQYSVYLLSKLEDPSIDGAFLDEEIEKCALDVATLQHYLVLTGQWNQAY